MNADEQRGFELGVNSVLNELWNAMAALEETRGNTSYGRGQLRILRDLAKKIDLGERPQMTKDTEASYDSRKLVLVPRTPTPQMLMGAPLDAQRAIDVWLGMISAWDEQNAEAAALMDQTGDEHEQV